MKEQIKKIVGELQEVIEATELEEIEDKDLLDFAVKIYLSEKIPEYKKENIGEMGKSKSPQGESSNLATEKQVGFLLKLGYDGDTENLTKTEASELIKTLKEKKGSKY